MDPKARNAADRELEGGRRRHPSVATPRSHLDCRRARNRLGAVLVSGAAVASRMECRPGGVLPCPRQSWDSFTGSGDWSAMRVGSHASLSFVLIHCYDVGRSRGNRTAPLWPAIAPPPAPARTRRGFARYGRPPQSSPRLRPVGMGSTIPAADQLNQGGRKNGGVPRPDCSEERTGAFRALDYDEGEVADKLMDAARPGVLLPVAVLRDGGYPPTPASRWAAGFRPAPSPFLGLPSLRRDTRTLQITIATG